MATTSHSPLNEAQIPALPPAPEISDRPDLEEGLTASEPVVESERPVAASELIGKV